jgi:molybdate/tungstate transport system substrate-binding protein
MAVTRRGFTTGLGISGAALIGAAPPAFADRKSFTVAYAGSMGVLMDRGLGPAYGKIGNVGFRGIGEGAFALAHLLAAGTMHADVFVSITSGPIKLLQQAGLIGHAVPVASTAMVIAYSAKSRFAAQMKSATAGRIPWYKVLGESGFRFGRTDPRTDPQGRNILFTFDLAGRYYHHPHLGQRILGPVINPAQIFTEPSLLARLAAGQLDAASAYESAARSLNLPFIALPPQINLSDPAMAPHWYDKTTIIVPVKGHKTVMHPQPLVFYAAVLNNAADPKAAQGFVDYMTSKAGQSLFSRYGYNKPHGHVV